MDELRIVLLVAGLSVIALVYLLTRRKRSGSDAGIQPTRREPVLGKLRTDETRGEAGPGGTPAPQQESLGDAAHAHLEFASADKIVTLRVALKQDKFVSFAELQEVLRGHNLEFGDMDIFHRWLRPRGRRPVFSVANMLEPGSFGPDSDEESIPGVTLFMALPGPVEATRAFEQFLDTARAVAAELDGRLLDASGSALSVQRIGYIRDEIVQYEHQRRLGRS